MCQWLSGLGLASLALYGALCWSLAGELDEVGLICEASAMFKSSPTTFVLATDSAFWQYVEACESVLPELDEAMRIHLRYARKAGILELVVSDVYRLQKPLPEAKSSQECGSTRRKMALEELRPQDKGAYERAELKPLLVPSVPANLAAEAVQTHVTVEGQPLCNFLVVLVFVVDLAWASTCRRGWSVLARQEQTLASGTGEAQLLAEVVKFDARRTLPFELFGMTWERLHEMHSNVTGDVPVLLNHGFEEKGARRCWEWMRYYTAVSPEWGARSIRSYFARLVVHPVMLWFSCPSSSTGRTTFFSIFFLLLSCCFSSPVLLIMLLRVFLLLFHRLLPPSSLCSFWSSYSTSS
ncbi:unnamed protein product [Prorocentrum cordatum]|uniref:Uncharacterized protein n=2 Tax=Prorocentrum cordatum TaxID=2364126 RepID=A0ABN9VUX8_9DINO|nr:unnamed protein product [Polarella glacialis]